MKKLMKLAATLFAFTLLLTACGSDDKDATDYSGTFTGYSWKGEIDGVTFEEASQYIETTITLDKEGIITDFEMNFVKRGDNGDTYRNDPTTTVTTNFETTPTMATLGDDKQDGASMFDISTADMMSLYVVDINENGEVAFGLVDPMTRYLFEIKLPADYDYTTSFGDLTISNGFTPTVLTSSSGMIKPDSFDEIANTSMLDIDQFSYVISHRGDFEGLTNETSVKDMLIMAGVTFEENTPTSIESNFGFHSAGGWDGNYEAIKNEMIGKSAVEVTALASFEGTTFVTEKNYADSINEDNFFGVNTDTVSTATKTIQNSYTTFSGATVRISRENTSFQRALVEAGLLTEEDVIKGRF